jgi:hypothetical protein
MEEDDFREDYFSDYEEDEEERPTPEETLARQQRRQALIEELKAQAPTLLSSSQSYAMSLVNTSNCAMRQHEDSVRKARASPGGLSYDTACTRFEIWDGSDLQENGAVHQPPRWFSAISNVGFELFTAEEIENYTLETPRYVVFQI